MLVRNLVSFEKFSILTKVGFEYQHSLSHHLLNLRKRFVVFKTDQTNGLSITIIISGTNFKMCLGMPGSPQNFKAQENSFSSRACIKNKIATIGFVP